jgi:hypothetical protein
MFRFGFLALCHFSSLKHAAKRRMAIHGRGFGDENAAVKVAKNVLESAAPISAAGQMGMMQRRWTRSAARNKS